LPLRRVFLLELARIRQRGFIAPLHDAGRRHLTGLRLGGCCHGSLCLAGFSTFLLFLQLISFSSRFALMSFGS
jgi:hypothetical protein